MIAPAMAFYGGLGDLMATAAMGDWDSADEITIAVALDSWRPTRGTRLTGERNPGRRFIFSNNRLERARSPPGRTWAFPHPSENNKWTRSLLRKPSQSRATSEPRRFACS